LQQQEGEHYETRVFQYTTTKVCYIRKNVKDMGSPFGPLQLSREIVIVNCISRRALWRYLMSAVWGGWVASDVAKLVIIHKRI
jgi:hypothetical protein